MDNIFWIVIGVGVVLTMGALVAALVVGGRRRVSLKEETPASPPQPSGGGYRADGGFSFTTGGDSSTAPPAEQTPAETGSAAGTADDAPLAAQPTTGAPDAAAGTTPPTIAPPENGQARDLSSPAGTATPEAATAPATPATTADEPAAREPDDVIAPSRGRLAALRGRLAKSQNALGRSLLGVLGGGDLDDESWQDIEDTLVMADLGAPLAAEITEELRSRVAEKRLPDAAAARALLKEVLVDAVDPTMNRAVAALGHEDTPAVVLVVGVNGTGKTTTTGKLARVLVSDGHSVVLGAADTFRAAAAEQLATWAQRSGAAVVRGPEGSDPAAVAFDAVAKGIDAAADVVLIDTAGRLHTKTGLMDELGKVKRVVEKRAVVDEVLLVIDATTGQNGLAQAKVFGDVVDVTGIVLTKLDGTAKGGIVFAVQRQLGVPVKLVGLGEGPDDLAPFEPEAFVDALLGS